MDVIKRETTHLAKYIVHHYSNLSSIVQIFRSLGEEEKELSVFKENDFAQAFKSELVYSTKF